MNALETVIGMVLAVADATPDTTEDTPTVAPVMARDKQVWCKGCNKWTDHTHVSHTEGTDKTGEVVTRVAAHARRGAFAPQQDGESFTQYQERLRLARMADAERKRKRRETLKESVYDKARATMHEHGTDRDTAVHTAVPLKDLHTRVADGIVAGFTTNYRRGFSAPQYRRNTYDAFLVLKGEQDGPFLCLANVQRDRYAR
jgi:hypothetical protein